MTTRPQTWHYGLVARYWAEFNTEGPEIACFQGIIERFGQPALDAGCGTGRLLVPFLRAGLDVDGCDLSPDMLACCHARAEREGLSPRLYAQALHELDLPGTYRTIVVCGAFGLGGDRARDMEALRRFHRLLEPAGALAMDLYLPYEAVWEWPYWLKEKRHELPRQWPAFGDRERAADGSEFAMRTRLVDLDPVNQVVTRQMQVELWRDGQRVAQEEHTLKEGLYFRNEMLMMLGQAGFTAVEVLGGYSGSAATVDDDIVLFIAHKDAA